MKKQPNFLPRLLLFICITSLVCCKDEQERKIAYFTLTADPSYVAPADELWIILHDDEGKPLDAQLFQVGTTVKFYSFTPPARFSVTLASYDNARQNVSLETYLGELRDASWTLRSPPLFDAGTINTSFQINISGSDLGRSDDAAVSDGTGFRFSSSVFNSNFSREVVSSADRRYFISLLDKEGNPRYKFLEHEPAGDVTYTLSDFTSYDKESVLAFPSTPNYLIYTLGYEDGQYPSTNTGYITNLRNAGQSDQVTQSVTLGFVNRFSNYFISAYTPMTSSVLGYEAFGPAPSTVIDFQDDFDIEVTNRNLVDFSLSGNNFSWFKSYWINVYSPWDENSLPLFHSWEIYGSDLNIKNPIGWPDAFDHKSLVGTEDFSYMSTEVYKSTRSFAQYIDANFKDGYREPYQDRHKNIH